MKSEHRKTLERVFRKPAPTDIPWAAVQSMLVAAGVSVRERSDSRMTLVMNGELMVLQRPHPKPLAVAATVRDIASFLSTAGVSP